MWDGFSEDDIQRLKAGECTSKGHGQEQSSAVPVLKLQSTHSRGSGKKNIARERMLQRPIKALNDAGGSGDIPENARLSKPKNVASKTPGLPQLIPNDMSEDVNNSPQMDTMNCEPASTPPPDAGRIAVDTISNQGAVCIKIKEGKNYEVMSAEKTPLDEFQSRHKLMEEQNRRRKELLAKALADRKKKTHAEARRLQQIQEELQKLDALLSNDVGILRNQIEAASLEFMDAQKRYDKAEKEFLEAKLNLFGKLERKELLTEHLCKIIEQNEMRKAKKLSELMDKLDLGVTVQNSDEEQKNTVSSVILPTLCALDEVSYSACNTLKSRQSESKGGTETASSTAPALGAVEAREGVRTVQTEAALLQQVGGGCLEDSTTL